jgi:hypothetical protein
LRRNPRPFGVCASHAECATRAGIRTPPRSSPPPDGPSPPGGRSPTKPPVGSSEFGVWRSTGSPNAKLQTQNSKLTASVASAPGLTPLHCRRARTRPVSCYALFQGWLLLSQPPGCLRARTSFPTKPGLRDLSRRSGLLPSRPWSLAPTASLAGSPGGIRGLIGVGSREAPRPVSALPPPAETPRLPLKAFRGEPAISGFGWHFTPTHSSSLDFEPSMGSGLQHALPRLHPGHG